MGVTLVAVCFSLFYPREEEITSLENKNDNIWSRRLDGPTQSLFCSFFFFSFSAPFPCSILFFWVFSFIIISFRVGRVFFLEVTIDVSRVT